MGFLFNLFSPKNQDTGSVVAHIGGILALMAVTPGGQEVLNAIPVFAAKSPWTLAAFVVVSYLLGARAGQPKQK